MANSINIKCFVVEKVCFVAMFLRLKTFLKETFCGSGFQAWITCGVYYVLATFTYSDKKQDYPETLLTLVWKALFEKTLAIPCAAFVNCRLRGRF